MWWLPRFMRKNQGSISLFMAIIMLSMFIISAVINDGARLRMARTIVQSAADSAAMSVLAKYDNALKDKYGLFALEETDLNNITDDFMDFFLENLSAEVPLSSDFNQAITNFMKTVTQYVTLSDEEQEKFDKQFGKIIDPLDLYDFNAEFYDYKYDKNGKLIDVEEYDSENKLKKNAATQLEISSVRLAYSIIEPQVLQTQMSEFAKYRGFISMADVIDLEELTNAANDSKKNIEEMSKTIDDPDDNGSGYKVMAEAAIKAYYNLSSRIEAIAFSVDMCGDHITKYNNVRNHEKFKDFMEASLPLVTIAVEKIQSFFNDDNKQDYIDYIRWLPVYYNLGNEEDKMTITSKFNCINHLLNKNVISKLKDEAGEYRDDSIVKLANNIKDKLEGKFSDDDNSEFSIYKTAVENYINACDAYDNAELEYNNLLQSDRLDSAVLGGLIGTINPDNKAVLDCKIEDFLAAKNDLENCTELTAGEILSDYYQTLCEELDIIDDYNDKIDISGYTWESWNKARKQGIKGVPKFGQAEIGETKNIDADREVDLEESVEKVYELISSKKTTADNDNQNLQTAQAVVNQRDAEKVEALSRLETAWSNISDDSEWLYNRLKEWNNKIKPSKKWDGLSSNNIVSIIKEIEDNQKYYYDCDAGDTVKFGQKGILGAIGDTEGKIADAERMLSDALTSVDKYLTYLGGLSTNEADKGKDNYIDLEMKDALEKDALMVQAELINLDGVDVNGWLEDTKTYLNGVVTNLNGINGLISSVHENKEPNENFTAINPNISAVDTIEAGYNIEIGKIKNYLNSVIGYAINYNNSNENLETYINTLSSDKDIWYNTCYKEGSVHKYFQYKPTVHDDDHGGLAKALYNLYKNGVSSITGQDANSTDIVISGTEKSILPSVLYHSSNKYKTTDLFAAKDEEYIKEYKESNGLTELSNVVINDPSNDIDKEDLQNLETLDFNDAGKQKKSFSTLTTFITNFGEFVKNQTTNLLVSLYDMSMFKSRVSKSQKEWQETYLFYGLFDGKETYDSDPNTAGVQLEKVLKDNQLTGELKVQENKKFNTHRYDTDEKEKNLYFVEKDENTFFDSEIEYILHGDMSQEANENNIYLKIYGIRMINNLVAVYQNQPLRELSAYASTWAGPFAPVVQLAIIAVIAALETYFDMTYMINLGFKVPFWKSGSKANCNLILSLEHLESMADKLSNAKTPEDVLKCLLSPKNYWDNCGLMVSYETYLWLFMILTPRQDKLLRSADLMQLNIRSTTDSSYKMADHYTYLRCHTVADIKPMFIGIGFTPEDMQNRIKRYKVASLIYQGY